MAAAGVLGLAIVVVAGLMVREVLLFRSGRHIIPRKAYLLRLVNSGLLMVVLGMLLVGMLLSPDTASVSLLLYWGVWSVLFIIFLLLTLNDLRMLRKVHHDRCEQLLRQAVGHASDDGEQRPKGL